MWHKVVGDAQQQGNGEACRTLVARVSGSFSSQRRARARAWLRREDLAPSAEEWLVGGEGGGGGVQGEGRLFFQEEEKFIRSGDWRGEGNSLSRGTRFKGLGESLSALRATQRQP